MCIVNSLVRTPLPNLMSPFLYLPQYRAVQIVAKSILNMLVPEKCGKYTVSFETHTNPELGQFSYQFIKWW